ncbi:MAG TPA: hypothetical protein VE619_11850 [Nitrososphaeraceae archaeon]|jgi:hypothetical protein|nr:hypothetical protein [Nitrososphaeraceae archaeon]
MMIRNLYDVPEHGNYNSELKKWFCVYWMTEDEWMDAHYYSPSSMLEEKDRDTNEELRW